MLVESACEPERAIHGEPAANAAVVEEEMQNPSGDTVVQIGTPFDPLSPPPATEEAHAENHSDDEGGSICSDGSSSDDFLSDYPEISGTYMSLTWRD